jgi:pyrimidine-nucleoside phosphorylase
MHIAEIIKKKRDGSRLSTEEIGQFIKGMVKGHIPDYQTAALLMAIYFQGMDKKETIDLTEAMSETGVRLQFDPAFKPVLDKHSTGGVGDKTTMVVAPLVAACGVHVAKLTGKGLDHTGGTLDKLSVFPGIKLELSKQEINRLLGEIGLVISGSTRSLVPGDRKLYSLRNLTGTVNCIPLIASSVMSKKLAGGADALILDVKTGSGAVINDYDQAKMLAKLMVDIGKSLGRTIKAYLTNMDSPLGQAVGNAPEVIEAIRTLQGDGPSDLVELSLELGSEMLILGKKADSKEASKKLLLEKIADGSGLAKFAEMVVAQNGDPKMLYDHTAFPSPRYKIDIHCLQSGFIKSLDTKQIGYASMHAGAGRQSQYDSVDPSAGLWFYKKPGDWVSSEVILTTIWSSSEERAMRAKAYLEKAVTYSDEPPMPVSLILDTIE